MFEGVETKLFAIVSVLANSSRALGESL